MSEQHSNRNLVIASIFIGIVVIGFGTYGIAQLIENWSDDPNDQLDNTNDTSENDEEEDPYALVISNYNLSIEFTDVDGNNYTIGSERDQFVILYFYSTTCGACDVHGPNLSEVYSNSSEGELLVISIAVGVFDDAAAVKGKANREDYTFVLCVDGASNQYSQYFSFSYIPYTLYIGENDVMLAEIGANTVEGIQENIEYVKNYTS